jgi:hypothetical protein
MAKLLKMMKRPSPMTLLWFPPEGQKLLFTDLKRRKLQIDFSFVRSGNQTNHPVVMPLLTLDDVHITSISPEIIKGNGNGKKQKYERIDAHFSKIEYNP